MSLYFGTSVAGMRGILPSKTKDKLKEITFTPDFVHAVCNAGGIPDVLTAVFCDGALCELWENSLADLYGGVSGYVYTVKIPDTDGENLNGGYKSEKPVEIIGCQEIPDIYTEILHLCDINECEITRFCDIPDSERQKMSSRIRKLIKRYNLTDENLKIRLIKEKVNY